MALHTTRYSPDTCSCIVEYRWDDQVDPTLRTHTYVRHVRACPDHPSSIAGFASLNLDNGAKNTAVAAVQSVVPASTTTWTFSPSRVIHLNITPNPTAQQRLAIRAALDNAGLQEKAVIN